MRIPAVSLALCLALAPVSALAATVGVSFSTYDDAFRNLLKQSIDKHAGETGVKLTMESAGNDAARQIQTIRDLAAARVDALIVVPIDGDMGSEISKIAADARIPLVYVNVMPANVDELPGAQAFVASNEEDSGTIEMREACRRLGGRGKVVVLMGELVHYAARQRSTDISNVIAGDDCKGIEVIERQSANWSRAQAEKQMGEWLAAGVRFDGVIANNDEMALGAIQAMKAAGLSMRNVVVAGIDATADALGAMNAGDLDVTVFQNATAQGAAALDAAMTLASGGTLPAKNYVPFELVTPETAARYAARN